jgi:hypothetical protein
LKAENESIAVVPHLKMPAINSKIYPHPFIAKPFRGAVKRPEAIRRLVGMALKRRR